MQVCVSNDNSKFTGSIDKGSSPASGSDRRPSRNSGNEHMKWKGKVNKTRPTIGQNYKYPKHQHVLWQAVDRPTVHSHKQVTWQHASISASLVLCNCKLRPWTCPCPSSSWGCIHLRNGGTLRSRVFAKLPASPAQNNSLLGSASNTTYKPTPKR